MLILRNFSQRISRSTFCRRWKERFAIDNNAAERAVKPFAIGRKNWMFFGSDRGGRTLAILASFTATCELFKINPWTWFRDTLTQLPNTSTDQIATLLPTKQPAHLRIPASSSLSSAGWARSIK